jgi:outer membrane protein assembly factor BamA
VLVKKPLFFFREAAEFGGLLPFLISQVAGNSTKSDILTNNSLTGITYYKYIKSESDFRYYIPLGQETNLALRSIFGIGAPMFNSATLPFEKRFFSGGANSIRAWKLRQVGPGSFYSNNPGVNFDQSGDLKLEFNSELRFPIYGVFKGALFLDAGNVWLFKNDAERPGAEFAFNRFYKEIAVGTGFGTRFDFSVFLFRVDFGVKLRDPAQPENQRWLFNKWDESDWIGNFMNLNLGIGYPF